MPDDSALPGLRDRDLQLVLLVALILQGISWWALEGYQLADSVEYMEHAQAFVRGQEVIDSSTNRSFGFSALLVPFFAVAEVLGIEDHKPVVWALRLSQMALGLLLVRVCARIGARLAGRLPGLVAGLLVAFNPVFLQYTVSPLSGIAAALCVGQALEALLEPGGFRRGLRGGLWLGAGLLMAYKTALIAVPLLGWLALRHRRAGAALLAGGACGLGAGALAAMAMDLAERGRFGSTLGVYLLENLGGVGARLAAELGLIELARRLMEAAVTANTGQPYSAAHLGPETVHQRDPVYYYLSSLEQMLVWPALILVVLGLLRVLGRPRWRETTLPMLLLVNAGLMSLKGSKDFRLWLPLLPMIAPLSAMGWSLLAGRTRALRGLLRVASAWVLLVLAGVLGLAALLGRNTRRFAGYWRAMAWVDAAAAEQREARPGAAKLRVASAWHWAVFLRESADVELIKLPRHLDGWNGYPPEERQRSLDAVRGLDCFLTHLPVLTNHPELLEAANRDFEVAAAFHDRGFFEDIGPILVLRRRAESGGGRPFFEVIEGQAPELWLERAGPDRPVDFIRAREDAAVERLSLLGWDWVRLPGEGCGWLTYTWFCASPTREDWLVVERLSTEPATHTWRSQGPPAWGLRPTSSWRAGWIVREGRLVVAARDPYDWRASWRPLGAGWSEESIPAHLWVALARPGGEGRPALRMQPARPGEEAPLRRDVDPARLETSDGYRFRGDGCVHVGGFDLPLDPRVRALER